MTGVAGLFKKANQIAGPGSAKSAGHPVQGSLTGDSTPQVPRATGFKIGGSGRPGPVEQGEVVTPGGVQTPVADAASPAKASPAAAKSFGGFKIGGSNGVVTTPPAKQESAGTAETSPPVQAAQPSAPAPLPTPAGPLPGETPASAPQRTLPDDVSVEVKRFIANLDHLHTLAPEPELATSAIRSIMMELKSQPQYMKHVSDSDVSVMISMMRETMGLVRVVKEQKAAKRTAKVKAGVQDVLDDLADLNF